ncbi:hypothetical protein EV193_103127 [Herbihabitans rhizosphaerae]|uniref:Uncharacterized protein n=1 Tax=Herbihabitans rhizosphaerae TaxID=1872711 RepID=A0A4V2ETE7_9PSEU|nr:hypothetical protein [Herbihabitans rhizosphaerae]RZS40813.1 hypothetical protein EV193_103127 [Herbihabitans rhizosphaerae]
MRGSSRVGLLGVAVIIAAAGCGTITPGAPLTQDLSPPRVVHPKAEVPKDRDERAVMVALRQVDACALLDPAAAGSLGFTSKVKPWAQGPHRCMITKKKGDDEVTVRAGDKIDHARKYDDALLTLSGAKAYRNTDATGDVCTVNVPVSFDVVVEFQARKGSKSTSDDRCTLAETFAAAGMAKLANQDTVRTAAPLSAWDPCALLNATFGTELDRFASRLDSRSYGIDGCQSGRKRTDGSPASAEYELLLHYQSDPAAAPDVKIKAIGDRHVDVRDASDASGGCVAKWSAGPSGSQYPNLTDAVIEMRAPDCAKAETSAATVVELLKTTPQPGPVQRPLLYKAEEPDEAIPGACVHMRTYGPGSCEPYHEVTLPAEAKDVLKMSTADPNVGCAVGLEAVRRHFGPRMLPVTGARSCQFVEPEHAVEVEVTVSADSDPNRDAGAPEVTNRRAVTVAGRPGLLFDQRSPATGIVDHRLSVSAGPGPGSGAVQVSLRQFPQRGSVGDLDVETRKLHLLEPMLAEILTKYFA